MSDFNTLSGSVNAAAGTVTLTWSLSGLSEVNSTVIIKSEIWRSPFGSSAFALLASNTGADFSGHTYTDTVPTAGEYQYEVRITVGVAPHTVTLVSNAIGASTLQTVTLTGSVSGRDVTLSWSAGSGLVDAPVNTLVQRSADGGTTYHTARDIPGAQAENFFETLSTPGVYKYRVIVFVEEPELPDALGEDTQITSNVVTLTIS